MKSIITSDNSHCFICGKCGNLEKHHIIYGTANRIKSERYGLTVMLCHDCHNEPPYGVHFNKENDNKLKQIAQSKFEESHSRIEWLSIFHKNYI